MEAVCQFVTCVSSVNFFAPALPAQLFLSQHFCVFAPVFLGHSLAVWVALALQNMPPKARAPEVRMVFGWGQLCGVEICTYSGPSRCLPTVLKGICVCKSKHLSPCQTLKAEKTRRKETAHARKCRRRRAQKERARQEPCYIRRPNAKHPFTTFADQHAAGTRGRLTSG